MMFGLILLFVIWLIYALFVGVTNLVIASEVNPSWLNALVAANGTYLAGWLAVMVWLRRRIRAGTIERDQFFLIGMIICWIGTLMLIFCFWVLASTLSEPQRAVVVVALMAFVMASAMGTLRVPTRLNRGALGAGLPFLFPIGIGSWFVLNPEGLGWAMASVVFIFGGLAWLLRAHQTNNMRSVFDIFIENERLRAEKSRFLAAASHDLDQPLQSARLFLDQVRRSGDAGVRDRAAQRMEWAMESMQAMIRQVTHHLQLEAGVLEPRRESVQLGPLLAKLLELHEHAAGLAGVELKTLAGRWTAMADPVLVERTLSNYVTNAIRHAKAHRVLVGARKTGRIVTLWVIDDGEGIPLIDHPRLFDDYTQGSNHGDEVRGGFGLGLGSARRMAELMGGQAGHDPRWTRGSAFFLELEAG